MEQNRNYHENKAFLRGVMIEAPVFSHRNHDISYMTFPISVLRMSGTEDCVHVILPEGKTEEAAILPGEMLEVDGEVRSFNNKSGKGSRLLITFFAKSIQGGLGEYRNDIFLSGVICKKPILRVTPLGREICDLMLAVNRKYGRADYLPCIAWGSLAKQCDMLDVGEAVKLRGRLQSRNYIKVEGGETIERTAFEVSVMEMEFPGTDAREDILSCYG